MGNCFRPRIKKAQLLSCLVLESLGGSPDLSARQCVPPVLGNLEGWTPRSARPWLCATDFPEAMIVCAVVDLSGPQIPTGDSKS